jgi:hypothetical protein
VTPRADPSPAAVLSDLVRHCSGHDLATTAALGWQPTTSRGRRAAAAVEGAAALPDDLVAAVTALALPSEQLLLLGADDRVIPHDGVNSYGFPTADPDPLALLSSCTANPPQRADLAVVDAWREAHLSDLLHRQRSLTPSEWRTPTAASLADVLALPADDVRRLVLTPSGTDAEAVVAAIAVYSQGRPVVSILVGAVETGSGTLQAAAGRSTTAVAPLGEHARAGEPLDGLGDDLVRVVDIDVRDSRGRARRAFDVEAEVEAHVEAALHDGATAVVHAVDCSKTGLSYLAPEWVATWRSRHPATVRVLVDCAQARTKTERLHAFLAAGASVLTTGSKAMSGAPFSGVLVLDDGLLTDAESCDRLPAGISALLSVADLPEELARLGSGWEPVNLGLLARWETALMSQRHFREIPTADRERWREVLIGALRDGLGRVPGIEVLAQDTPSVLSFTASDRAGALAREPLTQLHRSLAGRGVYLGQPAELVSGGAAVLRAAVGNATLVRAADAADPVRAVQGVAATTVEAVREQLQNFSHVR